MTKAEKEEFKNTKKQRDVEAETRKGFKHEYKEKKAALKVLAGKRSAQAKKRATQKATPEDILARHKVLNMLPKGALPKNEVSKMCPPGGHIWNGWKTGSWHAHLPPYTRIIASWSVYGHREGAIWCLKTMWQWWLEDNNVEESACIVKGLF